MPFGDGRGPVWANSENSTYIRSFARCFGRGLRRGLGLGYRRGYVMDSRQEKEYLEDERRYLQERLKQIDTLLSR